MNRNRTWTVDQLRDAVKSSISMNETLRRLKLSTSPGNHANISKWVREYGFDTTHFKGKSHGTSKPREYRPDADYLVKDGPYITSSKLRSKLLKSGVLPPVCVNCGLGPQWCDRPLTLQLDHINGNPTDNRIQNLRLLCPNCHTQTTTFGRQRFRSKRYTR